MVGVIKMVNEIRSAFRKDGERFLIESGWKIKKASEEVFAVRHFLNGFEIYSKSPKISYWVFFNLFRKSVHL